MQNRNITIDIYKGLAIILIVLGHLETTKLINDFIFLFHVPAFFFIAGMTFRIKEDESIWSFVRKKAYRLLLPYLCFTIIISITQLMTGIYVGEVIDMTNRFSLRTITLNCLDVLVGGGVKGATLTQGPAWFLYALFVASILFWYVNKLKINKIVMGGGILVLFILSIKLGVLTDAPFRLGQSIAAVFFMWCGQMYKAVIDKYQNLIKPFISAIGTALGFIALLFVAWWLEDSIDMAGNYYPSSMIVALTAAIVGCVALHMFSSLISKSRAGKVFVYYGLNSMLILGLHIPLRNVFRLCFSKIGLTAQQSSLPIFVLILLASIPLICFVNKYMPFLVGMRKVKQ